MAVKEIVIPDYLEQFDANIVYPEPLLQVVDDTLATELAILDKPDIET